MSYSFDGANDSLDGQFTSTYQQPITIACWIKRPGGHPSAAECAVQFNNDATDAEDTCLLRTNVTLNEYNARADAASIATAAATKDIGTTAWSPWLGVFTNTGGQDVYIGDQTGHSATNVLCAAMSFIGVGETTHNTLDWNGLIAEVAIWRIALSGGQIASYQAGNAASGIAASDLIGYWPLSANTGTHANLGIDAGGTLTVTSATFSSDHPTITSGNSIAAKVRFYQMLRTGTY